jgi:itaconyl-CoA hydratase
MQATFTEVVSVQPGGNGEPGTVVFRHWERRHDGIVVFEGERSTLVRPRPS